MERWRSGEGERVYKGGGGTEGKRYAGLNSLV